VWGAAWAERVDLLLPERLLVFADGEGGFDDVLLCIPLPLPLLLLLPSAREAALALVLALLLLCVLDAGVVPRAGKLSTEGLGGRGARLLAPVLPPLPLPLPPPPRCLSAFSGGGVGSARWKTSDVMRARASGDRRSALSGERRSEKSDGRSRRGMEASKPAPWETTMKRADWSSARERRGAGVGVEVEVEVEVVVDVDEAAWVSAAVGPG
jgi:hypothetical protein